jgi:hypothetical protein
VIHKAEDYVSVEEYARLCGVSVRNIRDRIRAKSISFIKVDIFYAVNVRLSPPQKAINTQWRILGKKTPYATLNFPVNSLKEIGTLCRGKHFSEGIIYEAVLINKLDGYIIGDKVFVNAADAENYYRNAK